MSYNMIIYIYIIVCRCVCIYIYTYIYIYLCHSFTAKKFQWLLCLFEYACLRGVLKLDSFFGGTL